MNHNPETDDDGKPAVRKPGSWYSGFVIVVLADDVEPPDEAETLHDVAVSEKLTDLAEMLDHVGHPRTRRLITSVGPAEVRRLERMERQRISLIRFWRVDLRDLHKPLPELARLFMDLPEVRSAYAELVAHDPQSGATIANPLAVRQGYLDPAPRGVDAPSAWKRPGGRGQGIVVCDLEQAWFAHEDLPPNVRGIPPDPRTPLANQNRHVLEPGLGAHGAAVLGIVSGVDNDRGIVGIAPSIQALLTTSHFDGAEPLHVADAITAAVAEHAISRVDILLLEVQRDDLPTEVDNGDWQAIAMAVDNGMTVVEAAGNAGVDLDDGRLGSDSGAILVGSARSVLEATTHRRRGTSNFGARVHCYAWGENVVTSGGAGELTPTAPPVSSYTGSFDGTSSAAAILAGAAASTQGMFLAARGRRLAPTEMRRLLADGALGTAHAAGGGAIGVMPDLCRIVEQGFPSIT